MPFHYLFPLSVTSFSFPINFLLSFPIIMLENIYEKPTVSKIAKS